MPVRSGGFSSSRSSSFSSKSSSSSFKSSSSKSSTSKPKVNTSKSKVDKAKPKEKTTTATTQKKIEVKVEKPVKHTNDVYQHNSTSHGWMPFMFMDDWFEDDDEVIIVEDGQVVQPQDNGYTGMDFISIFLTLAVLAVFVWSFVRVRRHK